MTIKFLGTNGWYTSETGNTPCILIDTRDHYIILDAGNGIYKIDQYITQPKPISLFITHFHLDHTSGLHTLKKFNFPQGIDVYIGPGRTKDFQTLVNPPYTIGYLPQPQNIANLKTPIRLHELPTTPLIRGEGGVPFKATALQQKHAYTDHGYKLELEGKTIAYTGDCAFTPETKTLAQNADLLICECSNKKTQHPDLWGHLDPTAAATLAKESQTKQLILTHFNAAIFTTLQDRKQAEQEAQKTFPQTLAATDGMEITL